VSEREHEHLCGKGKADPCFADDFTDECTCWCHRPTVSLDVPPTGRTVHNVMQRRREIT
jgi:hypothetical protein